MPPIRLLDVCGKSFEMGFQHGKAYGSDIHELSNERISLCTDETWTGRYLSHTEVMALAYACVDEHYRYSPELMAELEGMASATGLSLPELVIVNGFTDFVDTIYNVDQVRTEPLHVNNDCTTFTVGRNAALNRQGMLGQTWDMHATATPYVILLRGNPEHAPRFMTMTITGCVGMIGMNEAGIAIGINNLMSADGQIGVTWPFIIRKALMQTNLTDAMACITSAKLAGAHNFMLMDSTGNGYNIEAMPTKMHIEPIGHESFVHANICLHENTQEVERPLDDDSIEDSTVRRNRAVELLEKHSLTPQDLMNVTRDRSQYSYSICATSEPPFFSETCGAAVMRPATREFWAVWGLPNENEYERFTL